MNLKVQQLIIRQMLLCLMGECWRFLEDAWRGTDASVAHWLVHFELRSSRSLFATSQLTDQTLNDPIRVFPDHRVAPVAPSAARE
jgi:hypothetical protein